MDQEFQKIIEERRKYLSSDMLQAIDSVDAGSKLPEIIKKNGLLIDQGGALMTEVILVVYGIEPLASFISNIQKEVGLEKEKALAVSKDVNELIFKNIREKLQKLNEEEELLERGTEANTKEDLNRENVLNDIENPPKSKSLVEEIKINLPDKPAENDIVVKEQPPLPQKTDGITITNSVSDKKEIGNIVEANLAGPVSLSQNNQRIEEKTKIPQKSIDPYREPIE